MRKLIISLTIIAGLGLITQSCFDGLNDFTYKGPPVVEFSNLTHSGASWTSVGNYWSYSMTGNNPPIELELQVALVGPHQAQDKTISFFIPNQVYRDTDANRLTVEQPPHENFHVIETIGQEGVDYNFSSNSITIPANSSFGSVGLDILSDEVDLIIVLEEGDLAPSENYKLFRVTLLPVFQLEVLSANVDEGTVSGSGNFIAGGTRTIEATAKYGFAFEEWTGDIEHAADALSARTTVTMPAEDISLTAYFTGVPFYELSFTADPEEGADQYGAVVYDEVAGEDVIVTTHDFIEGEEVNIRAIAESGYRFAGWRGQNAFVEDVDAAETVVIMPDQNVALVAKFVQVFGLALEADPEEGGTVEGAGEYEEGDKVTIRAIPEAGYVFVEWTGDIEHLDDPSSSTATFTIPATDVTLTALFEEDVD